MTQRSSARIAQLAGLTLLWACGDDSGDGSTGTGPITVATVEVTAPATNLTAIGATVQLQATAKDANGNSLGGKSFTWQSSDADVASVSDAGLVTAVNNGSVTIRATTDGVTGSAQLTVAQVIATVEVTSTSDTLRALRDTTRLAAEGKDSRGNTVTGSTFTWSSSDTTVATVDTTGLVEAVSNGSVTIGATADSITGTAEITVAQALLSVEVTPGVDTLTAIGLTTQFSARALDSLDNVLTDATFTWTSSDSTVALPDSTGLTTAVSNGTATISAVSEGGTGSATLLVEQIATQLATVSGDNQQVAGGATLPDALVVKVTDSNDSGVSGVAITWEVTEGGGAINAVRDTTDAEGLARATWTLGLARDNAVAVMATGLPAATLLATGLSPCVAPSAPPSPSAANPTLPSYTVRTLSTLQWPYGTEIKAIDLLGDGQPDVLILTAKVNATTGVDDFGGSFFLLRNTGAGNFERDSLDVAFASINKPGVPVIFDADGDGLDDAYIPQFGLDAPPPPDQGARDLLLMQRSGRLVDESTTRLSPHDVTAANIFTSTAADVDCDGDIDVYVGTASPGPTHLLINQGAGFFVPQDERLPPDVVNPNFNYQAAQFCDVDRDGAPDLVLGGGGGTVVTTFTSDLLVMNDGFGKFTPAADGAIPILTPGPNVIREHLLCEDFDNDGWPDIVFGELAGAGAEVPQMYLWINNQDGTFRDGSAELLPAAASMAVGRFAAADLNADGWLDIVARCDVLMNGGGTFVHFTLDDQLPPDPISGEPLCGDFSVLGNLVPLVTSATGKVDLFLAGLAIPMLLVQN